MMTEKILTVSVAAYNVEETIREVLDSLLVPEILDWLEVFVVDDGGTDGTLTIAEKYARKYPDTVRAIHKENGGYGSTVNYSLAHATGKYFKLLDGDDWYDSANLPDFIHLLKEIDVDLVITPYVKRGMRSGKVELQRFCNNEQGIYQLKDIRYQSYVDMYYLTWRTCFLRETGFSLREHCMYTDTEYAYYPLLYVKKTYCWQRPVYIYRTEVSGQTMSLSGKLKHYKEHAEVFWGLNEKYKGIRSDNSAVSEIYKKKLIGMAVSHIRLWCWKETSLENLNGIKEFYSRLEQEAPDIARGAQRNSKLVWGLTVSHYMIYPFCNRFCLWKFYRSRGGGD